ncbi:MAG TPA: aminotransferase class V-fold PLP-dependent enzyme [Solirubrobacteraceae bacterium]
MTDGISRRRFVGAGAAVLGGGAAFGAGAVRFGDGTAPESVAEAAGPGDEDVAAAARSWRGVRRLFSLDPRFAHLSAFILAPHSAPVRAAIERHRRGFDRDPRRYLTNNEHREERVAVAAARHLGTSPGQIALTDSTTMGLGLALAGLRLGAGDEIVLSRHEHYSSRTAAQLTGARVEEIELYPPRAPERAGHDEIVGAIDRAIGPATKVVVVTWVHSSSGIRLPLRAVADAVGDRALLVVDAAHALGTGPIDAAQSGADVLVAGAHKWLLGPRGTGIVWARGEAWERIQPTIPTFRGDQSPGARHTPGGYHSFEHRWAAEQAFRLQQAVGQARIGRRIDQLANRLRAGLRGIPGVTVHAPDDPRLHSGVVTFSLAGRDAASTADGLSARRVHGSVTPYDVQLARLGATWMNTPGEVDRAIRAVRDLAA